MMFDPPDYPYKELSETYDDLLLNKNKTHIDNTVVVQDVVLTETSSIMSMQRNDARRYSNVNSSCIELTTNNIYTNKEHSLVQSDNNLLNYEPTLLDENTVNQFLLPLHDSTQNTDKDEVCCGPDLLALHSCVICHGIFTTEADLLDHTIAFHASMSILEPNEITENSLDQIDTIMSVKESANNNQDFETDWLICRICERVLSTALEVEPKEQLCCVDLNGKCSMTTRRLHTMFVCDLCNGLFADGDALDKHRITCYNLDNNIVDQQEVVSTSSVIISPQCSEVCFTCDLCRKQFSSTEELKTHLLQCQKPLKTGRKNRTYSATNNNKMWNCGSCNQLFVTARDLYRHKRGEDRPEGAPLTAYVCEECDKVLGSMCALHTHKKMHKVSKPGYPCRICGRRFNQSGHLAIHMRKHTGERPYPCDLCPKAFKVKVERDDHRRTHTGERPFACNSCPKTFTAAARLREHARIHTDQRPYRCDICGAAFRRPYARTVHTLIHTGEKPHECDVCGTAFRRSGDMWKHKRTLHGV